MTFNKIRKKCYIDPPYRTVLTVPLANMGPAVCDRLGMPPYPTVPTVPLANMGPAVCDRLGMFSVLCQD